MLDAIVPTATYAATNAGAGVTGYTAGVTKNAYRDTTAKTVGYAMLNGIVGKYDGTFWRPLADSTKILSGDFVYQVNAIDIGGVSGNGLIYTGTNAPFSTAYRLDTHFGVSTWSSSVCNSVNPRWNTTNICRTRGMLLPTYSETQISTTNSYNPCGGTGNVGGSGVPSNSLGYSWTSTSRLSYASAYIMWSGTSASTSDYNVAKYIRCVR